MNYHAEEIVWQFADGTFIRKRSITMQQLPVPLIHHQARPEVLGDTSLWPVILSAALVVAVMLIPLMLP